MLSESGCPVGFNLGVRRVVGQSFGRLAAAHVQGRGWALGLVPVVGALVLMGLGALHLEVVYTPESLWLNQDDFALTARQYRHEHFERAKEETVVITASAPGA